ncbi:MAG: cation transporter [Chloroflexi bacterium]|nr:cation transporter [Chloroflexota bacterium]
MMRRLRIHPRRLLTAPRLRVTSEDERRSRLAIAGLVCGVCANRTERALRSIPGVRNASVDLASGSATIEHGGTPPEPSRLAAALDTVVIARPWRLRIEAWADRLGGWGRRVARRRA